MQEQAGGASGRAGVGVSGLVLSLETAGGMTHGAAPGVETTLPQPSPGCNSGLTASTLTAVIAVRQTTGSPSPGAPARVVIWISNRASPPQVRATTEGESAHARRRQCRANSAFPLFSDFMRPGKIGARELALA